MGQSARQPRRDRARPTAPTGEAGHRGERNRPGGATTVRARGLDRAIELLQLLHRLRRPVAVGEVARALKAPRSTVYEIVNRFLAAGILENAGSGPEVYFGRMLYLYADGYFASEKVLRLAKDEVRRLATLTGETSQFCMPAGNKYTVVAMQNSARLFRISSEIGALVPIPWTASGRFFVSHMELDELAAFIPPEDFRLQDGRMIDPSVFLAEAKAARARGIFALSGHVDDYATCLAAPVLNPDGVCFGCICFAVARTLPAERLDEFASLLIDSAQRLTAAHIGAPSREKRRG